MFQAAQMVWELQVLLFTYGDAHMLRLESALQVLNDLTAQTTNACMRATHFPARLLTNNCSHLLHVLGVFHGEVEIGLVKHSRFERAPVLLYEVAVHATALHPPIIRK